MPSMNEVAANAVTAHGAGLAIPPWLAAGPAGLGWPGLLSDST